ncbi:hypothetical protein HII12_001400 [Brettanomyces bruxellensis]|uniref:PX domain-containing protein n=1 Tax=Dekkera bruxellensis TaxID=5007 RepID=A0A8H6EY16_DEKBR|nr:hypothetical protein HII12_001400 [Brettanomyces bruxellensis]
MKPAADKDQKDDILTQTDTENTSDLDIHTSIISKVEISHPVRICKIIDETKNLKIFITGASKSTEVHSRLQPFIVYSIKLGPLIVKRRYSEFESLRSCLVKCYPTMIVPPIPEKQSLASNISQTTSSSLGIIGSNNSEELINPDAGGENDIFQGNEQIVTKNSEDKKHTVDENENRISVDDADGIGAEQASNHSPNTSVFLSGLPHLIETNKYVIANSSSTFLDPEVNFHDYLEIKENHILFKTSVYRLSPFNPLENLSNQLYLTLPLPSSADISRFIELADEAQFQRIVNFEKKFQKYEDSLDKIGKDNKRILKNFEALCPDLADLGSLYNSLSMMQDSNFMDNFAKLYEREVIFLKAMAGSMSLNFLDRIVELKHFAKDRKMVSHQLSDIQQKYKVFEMQEVKIQNIDAKANAAMGKSITNNKQIALEAPITDAELQTALFAKSKKPFYGKIPGFKKIGSVFKKYTDTNPDQTRRNKMYNLKLRLYQLRRQHEIIENEIGKINREVIKQLVWFHKWFKVELIKVVGRYHESMNDFTTSNIEAIQEVF